MESNIGFTYAINQFRWVLLFAHKKREFQIILLGPTWISTEVHSFFRSNASNVTVSSLWAIGFMGLAVFFFSLSDSRYALYEDYCPVYIF